MPHAQAPTRMDRTRDALRVHGLDALLVTPGPDLRYLAGYDATPLERLTCLVVPADGEASLVVPRLERPAARASPAAALHLLDWSETDDPYALVAGLLPGARRVAVDDHMWAAKLLRLRAAMPDTEQVAAGRLLSDLRMHKGSDEVSELRAAAAAIDRVHARIGEWLQAGRTEREVGRDIAQAILDEGHVKVDFVIVATGPNGASPHHEVSDRSIQAGDPVVVDIGGTTATGYCSDCTRMYCIGEPPARFADVFDVLHEAQRAAVRMVGPGVPAEAVDAAARRHITTAGFGAEFIHRTGHGIGLQTHEEPYIVEGNTIRLEPGMAFSVEPGIYLPGAFGARIEDIVVVTSLGVDVLNTRPTELAVL